MKLFLFTFLLLFSLSVAAQQSDSQLAYNYYQNKEYDKAGELFLKLYERTRASYYLDYHIICLINAKKYDDAEEVLKKYLKTDSNNKDFLINLGYIYEQQGKSKKSEEYYDKAVKKLIPNSSDIQTLANKFRNIREYGWATKTYLTGRELLKQPNAFMNEMGDNYMMERDYEKMFSLFEESLNQNPGSINTVTSKLSFARSYDVANNVDLVIKKQLDLIFKRPDYSPVFDELAVWFSLQTNDYGKALEHAIKLNSKVTDKLNIYINIAREALSGKRYAIAREAYDRVLQQGKENNNFYIVAKKEVLSCKYAEAEQQKTDIKVYQEIGNDCESFMRETGYINSNVDIVMLLSDIYAYKLNQPDSANHVLQKGEKIRNLAPSASNVIKSKRADLLAFTDNPWEALILYTQIEKANPNNDAGYEAKLKKAQLAYYEGDIMWAKAQFDVLKGSTSKLISNDALKMSHFINSNYEKGEDNSALERLAQTEYMIYKNQVQKAMPILDSIIRNCPASLSDYASLVQAKIFISEFKYDQATEILGQLKDHSTQTYIQAEAIFELANLKARIQDKAKALELYKKLVADYSGSVYSIEAGKLYREMEGSL